MQFSTTNSTTTRTTAPTLNADISIAILRLLAGSHFRKLVIALLVPFIVRTGSVCQLVGVFTRIKDGHLNIFGLVI